MPALSRMLRGALASAAGNNLRQQASNWSIEKGHSGIKQLCKTMGPDCCSSLCFEPLSLCSYTGMALQRWIWHCPRPGS
jgi:hypothetical protein